MVAEEVLLKDLGERIPDVRQGPDGSVWVLTDSPNGSLLKSTVLFTCVDIVVIMKV